jgi:hypothetical protein
MTKIQNIQTHGSPRFFNAIAGSLDTAIIVLLGILTVIQFAAA